jgi:HSP20 family protein
MHLENMIMAIKDLIPWNRGRDVSLSRNEDQNPFLTLHREVNRLFDDAFRGFDLAPFGTHDRLFARSFRDGGAGWPSIEVSEQANEVKVTAELAGLEEKDINVQLADGVLTISGEKKTETEDKDRLFSERVYGRFERHIPLEDIDEEKINASFKNGVLTITLPRTSSAPSNARRIAINGR